MKISPIIFGATGMVGKGVLLECLDSERVEKVMVINRQPGGISHPKLREIVQKDVGELAQYAEVIRRYDACFFCLGVTSVGKSEEEYTKLTYDLTMRVARSIAAITTDMTFCYVSGAGTDSTEKGKIAWARVKGRTENALLGMPFRAAYMFRPGFIQPLRGIRSRTALYNVLYAIFRPFLFLIRKAKSTTDTTRFGKAMMNVAVNGYGKKWLDPQDINLAAID